MPPSFCRLELSLRLYQAQGIRFAHSPRLTSESDNLDEEPGTLDYVVGLCFDLNPNVLSWYDCGQFDISSDRLPRSESFYGDLGICYTYRFGFDSHSQLAMGDIAPINGDGDRD
jgi:hypothetical protein